MALTYFNQQIHSSSICITPPAVEPVTLAQAKNQCRVDDDITQDDDLITSLIVAARRKVESLSHRAIVTQTWQYNLDLFPFYGNWMLPGPAIALPKPPCQSVVSVAYVATEGTTTTLSSSFYQVDTMSEPARIFPVAGQIWPVTSLYVPNAVQITFTCGYGLPTDAPATIPAGFQQAILLLVDHYWQNRGACSDVSLMPIPFGVQSLIDGESFGGYW